MAKVGRAVAAIHRHYDSVSTNCGTQRGELEDSVASVTTTPRGHGRRGSRASNKVPAIIVESSGQHEKQSLYPSLTTLASLDEQEDEFSCKDCCKAACNHFFNFTFRSCMYITCQQKEMHPRGSSANVEDMEVEQMKTSLQFHFLNPFQKWRNAKRRRFPWKLFVQLLNTILVTLQVRTYVCRTLERQKKSVIETSVLCKIKISTPTKNDGGIYIYILSTSQSPSQVPG
ncbi:hypothetical protein GBAR_LOCUS5021 [Geodia barretti]|uniref:Uncharacterized protein n=1 Tax=Geodia barretti TaxID=519541 RepID=A0AA35W7M8_GEOBA|nr:hypothetical protein GBAR_LOCUS5021 [Geodia barretti]